MELNDSFEVEGFNDSLVLEEDVKKYKCTHCEYSSRWPSNLKRHNRLKHQQIPNSGQNQEFPTFICDYCGKGYKHRYSLSVHRKQKHTETYRFFCSRCNQGFTQLWNYRGHLAHHHPEFKLKCDVCGKAFSYKGNLRTHQKRCKKKYTCKQCTETFKSKKNLVDHERGKHGNKRFVCDLCRKSFKWRSSLSYHKRHVTHTFF